MADQQQRYLTVYGGERVWAQVVRPGDSGWDEADEQPPAGTAEERLAYGRYLAGQLEGILMATAPAHLKYLRRLLAVLDAGQPFDVPVLGEAAVADIYKQQRAENDAYLAGLHGATAHWGPMPPGSVPVYLRPAAEDPVEGAPMTVRRPKTGEQVVAEHPWLASVRDHMREQCHDCGVRLGESHQWGCDAVTCSVCGEQWIACGCADAEEEEYIGVLHPAALRLCVERNLWCRSFLVRHGMETVITDDWDEAMRLNREGQASIRWYVPCTFGDAGAHPDLNRGMLALRFEIGIQENG